MLDLKLIQRVNLQFCYQLGWTHMQACTALEQVYGANTMHVATSRHWFQSFKAGRTTVVDLQRAPKERIGRSPGNIAAVKALIDLDKSVTVASLVHQTGLNPATVHRIIRRDLHLQLRCAKLLPAFLTPRHIVERFQHSRDMLAAARNTPSFLKKIVTMDEAWCYQYDPLLKRQASQWLSSEEPRPVHPRRTISIKKVLLVAFFDYKGMIHFEFLRGGTVDTPTFLQILGCFKCALRVKRPRQRRVLHMDNAPAHGSKDTKLHLLLTGQRTMSHPALSPDLAPSDFWLFPTLKKPLRGRRFWNLDEVEHAVRHQIGQITADQYRETMLKTWPMRWVRCVHWNGDYFEGRK